MPVDPRHAFADGPAFPKPSRSLAAHAGRLVATAYERHLVRRAWDSFERGAFVGPGVRLGPSAWCANTGPADRIRIGPGSVCRGIVRREEFGDGRIAIGDGVYLGDDTLISACDGVEIGASTLVAHGVQIFDNNSHPLLRVDREQDWGAIARSETTRSDEIEHAPVKIGDGAWLGFGAIVLRGVNIGDGAVVAAGAVVTADVAPFVVVAGNPARVVRELE